MLGIAVPPGTTIHPTSASRGSRSSAVDRTRSTTATTPSASATDRSPTTSTTTSRASLGHCPHAATATRHDHGFAGGAYLGLVVVAGRGVTIVGVVAVIAPTVIIAAITVIAAITATTASTVRTAATGLAAAASGAITRVRSVPMHGRLQANWPLITTRRVPHDSGGRGAATITDITTTTATATTRVRSVPPCRRGRSEARVASARRVARGSGDGVARAHANHRFRAGVPQIALALLLETITTITAINTIDAIATAWVRSASSGRWRRAEARDVSAR